VCTTVRPHPLLGAKPVDQQFEKETGPTLRRDLVPGDCLYVPSGMWHVAKAETDSLSIAIGVAALTAMDLYDELRARLAEWAELATPSPGARGDGRHDPGAPQGGRADPWKRGGAPGRARAASRATRA
jgi:hypothetical protein